MRRRRSRGRLARSLVQRPRRRRSGGREGELARMTRAALDGGAGGGSFGSRLIVAWFTMWRGWRKRQWLHIFTNERRARHGLATSACCPLCTFDEDVEHLFSYVVLITQFKSTHTRGCHAIPQSQTK
uniref:Uncharacterized protein n=1 Tax=Oryza glumipatula TaxID=40148 RepID=A0A0E0AV93_9ORYZ